MDKGKIKNLVEEDLADAQYKEDLETMESIELGEKVVVIKPYSSHAVHILKVSDFVKSNLDKLEFENPYSRKKVEFEEDDKNELQDIRKELLSKVKSIPHEIFLKLLTLIDKIFEKNVQMSYFNFIVDAINKILVVLPVFENINEAYSLEPHINEITNNFYKTILEHIDKEFEYLETNIEDIQLKDEFLTIPYDIRDMITELFLSIFTFMKEIAEIKEEFKYTNDILEIIYRLEDVRILYQVFYNKNGNDEKLINSLILTSEKIAALKEKARRVTND